MNGRHKSLSWNGIWFIQEERCHSEPQFRERQFMTWFFEPFSPNFSVWVRRKSLEKQMTHSKGRSKKVVSHSQNVIPVAGPVTFSLSVLLSHRSRKQQQQKKIVHSPVERRRRIEEWRNLDRWERERKGSLLRALSSNCAMCCLLLLHRLISFFLSLFLLHLMPSPPSPSPLRTESKKSPSLISRSLSSRFSHESNEHERGCKESFERVALSVSTFLFLPFL